VDADDHVDYTVDRGIATITLERPDVYNAFTRTTVLELNEAIRAAHEDDTVYAVVLTGAGDGFCAGADTTATTSPPRSTARSSGSSSGWWPSSAAWPTPRSRP